MSYCPRPSRKTKTAYTTPGKKTVNPPGPRTESCAAATSTIITNGGSSTTNTVYVPGPAGPAGPQGPAGADGLNGLGFIWRGPWALNYLYKKQDGQVNPLADVVEYMGSTYICIQDNESNTEENPEYPPDASPSFWQLVAAKGEGSLAGEQLTFFESLQNDLFDWVQNASVSDLIQAGIGAAGIILAGTVIADMISDDGSGDGEADQRFTGSDGYITSGYTAPDIKDVLTALCQSAGITFDVTALPDAPCEFSIGNQTSVRNIIGNLALTYQFDMVDTGGVLRFVPRTTTVAKTLTEADLGFADSPGKAVPYTVKRFQGTDLPKSITLKYPAVDLDYNTFTQTSQLFTYAEGQDVLLETPVTLPHDKAKQIVEVTLINAHLQRTQFSFTTSYKHVELEPGDVIETPMGLVRITRISEKADGLLDIEAADAGAELAVEGSGLTPQSPPASTNVPVTIGYSQTFFIDPNNLSDEDTGVRVYAAVHGYDAPGWPGAAIYVSTNNGGSYELIGSTTNEATVGLVAAVTPAADHRVWDETTTITVQLKTNSLVSKTASEVLNRSNWCMIGKEIIGFRSASLVGPKTYQLSGLLRGRQGTDIHVGTHEANELFVLLDDSLVKLPLASTDRLKTYKYKTVTNGSSLDKVSALDVQVISGNTLMWPITDGKITQVGSDWQVSYSGRARYNNELRDYVTTSNDSDFAGFGIVVYDTDGVTKLKTYTTTSETWIYTAAMQTADFGSVQSSLKVEVAAISGTYGSGYSVVINS